MTSRVRVPTPAMGQRRGTSAGGLHGRRVLCQDLQRCLFARCHGVAGLRSSPEKPALGQCRWVCSLSRRPESWVPPVRDHSRPKYIIKYILLIKTIVEAHKGKLLICVPACHSACVNKEDNRSFGKLFRELSNRYASQRILLTVIFLFVCTQK